MDDSLEDRLAKVLKRHLQLDDYSDKGMAGGFLNPILTTPLEIFDGKSDIEVLDRLSRALAVLHPDVFEQMTPAARDQLNFRLLVDFEENREEREAFRTKTGQARFRALTNLMEASENIRQLIDQVRREIEASPRTRKSLKLINMKALQTVDTAADWWERYSGRKVPTAEIKDAQPFARFLADLFEVLEIDSSPVTAHRAWLKNMPKSPERI